MEFIQTATSIFSGAEVRAVDLKALTGGIIHTKLWVVDQKHLYVGSANMDWRSLSQVTQRWKWVCLFSFLFRIHEAANAAFKKKKFSQPSPTKPEQEVSYPTNVTRSVHLC